MKFNIICLQHAYMMNSVIAVYVHIAYGHTRKRKIKKQLSVDSKTSGEQ